MRLYVELINQRYDDENVALGSFSAGEWKGLLERLEKAHVGCGVETKAEKATSFETGTGLADTLPRSFVLLLHANEAKDVAPLLALRDDVEAKGGVLRVLKTDDLSPQIEAVAGVLSGDHGFERRGVHFACVAGDECGLRVYQGDPGYDELVQTHAEASR